MLLYQWHELWRAGMAPFTYFADAGSKMYASQDSWLASLPGAPRTAAAFELMYRLGKDYEKPEFGIHSVDIEGVPCPVVERVALEKPFCRLLRFKRFSDDADRLGGLKDDPTVLVVAPLSGHHATLLRDTVRTLLADHKVYVTDWTDARMVPAEVGPFTLDDYVAYIEEFIRHIGTDNLHVMSVCQPTVPVLAAVSLMAGRGEPSPTSMVMMGGPIDPRESPTAVNNLATRQPLSWFENNVIHTVPANYPGSGRQVYPGFLQHAGLRGDEPGTASHVALGFLPGPAASGDLDDAAVAPQVLRRVQRRAGHAGAVLPRHHPHRVPGIPVAARLVGRQRRAREPVEDQGLRPADHRRRAGRHFRRRPDQGRAQAVHRHCPKPTSST